MSRSSAERSAAVRAAAAGGGGRLLGAVLLLALDCVVAAGFCEAWVRAFVPVKNVCWTFDATLGPHRCPDQTRTAYVEPGYHATLRTNSLGFHDLERSRDPAPGTFRIQVFGDSMIVGQAVSTDRTIPALLARHLDELGLPARFEVFNMASVDSTTSQILVYERFGRQYRPDLVVSHFMDDFPDNLLEVHGRSDLPHFRLDAAGALEFLPPVVRDLDSPWERFKRSSLLYRALANRVLESRLYHDARALWAGAAGRPSAGERAGREGTAARRRALVEQGWPLTLALIDAFRQKVEADGARFVLIDGLRFQAVNVGEVYQNSDLEAFCRERGIDYLATWEVLDAMKSAADRENLFFRDQHPTARGNEILARALAERLAELLRARRVFDGTDGGDHG